MTVFYAEDGGSTHLPAATYKDVTCLMTASLALIITEEKGLGKNAYLNVSSPHSATEAEENHEDFQPE
jgi:hypothetical protein